VKRGQRVMHGDKELIESWVATIRAHAGRDAAFKAVLLARWRF
jgi:hypothetical protein